MRASSYSWRDKYMRASGALMCLYRFSTRLLATIESPVAKNATQSRCTRCRSASVILLRKSPTSVEKSISSTVQVFFDGSPVHFIKRRYAMGRSVRHIPCIEQTRRTTQD